MHRSALPCAPFFFFIYIHLSFPTMGRHWSRAGSHFPSSRHRQLLAPGGKAKKPEGSRLPVLKIENTTTENCKPKTSVFSLVKFMKLLFERMRTAPQKQQPASVKNSKKNNRTETPSWKRPANCTKHTIHN